MAAKYFIRTIEQGQLQKIYSVAAHAGFSGGALVLHAVDRVRFQIADSVTLVAPDKLRMKRVGDDLLMALPDGDLQAPDIIVKGFFSVQDAGVQGELATGERLAYDLSALSQPSPGATAEGLQGISAHIGLTASPTAALDVFDSPWGMAGVGAGLLALGALGNGGGGGASATSSAAQSALNTLKAYTTDGSTPKTATVPNLTVYKTAGVKKFLSLADTSDASRIELTDLRNTLLTSTLLNNALDQLEGSSLTVEKVQAMVDAYDRILAVADSVITKTDAYPGASKTTLRASDYAAVGVSISDAIAATGVNHTLNLLNDAVGLVVSTDLNRANTKVDTIAELQTLATAANDVMALAKGASASGSSVSLIAGINALLDNSEVNSNNLTEVQAVITATADDGTGVDTVAQLQALVALAALKSYTKDSASPKLASTPTLTTYKNAGVKMFVSLTDTSDASRIELTDARNTLLTGAVLNNALDALDASTLTVAKVQAMVDAYDRLLAVADSVSSKTDAYPGASNTALLASDYAAIGINLSDAIGATGVNHTLNLLNDAVGLVVSADLSKANTKVDTITELQTLATAANDVMLLSKGAAASGSTTTQIAGLNALLDNIEVNSSNLAAVQAAITATADNGSGADTVAQLQGIVGLVRINDYGSHASGAATPLWPTTTRKTIPPWPPT